jgi:hypothetical protein
LKAGYLTSCPQKYSFVSNHRLCGVFIDKLPPLVEKIMKIFFAERSEAKEIPTSFKYLLA